MNKFTKMKIVNLSFLLFFTCCFHVFVFTESAELPVTADNQGTVTETITTEKKLESALESSSKQNESAHLQSDAKK